jgi:hypothetical protein
MKHTFRISNALPWSVWICFSFGSIQRSVRCAVSVRRHAPWRRSPGRKKHLPPLIWKSASGVGHVSRHVSLRRSNKKPMPNFKIQMTNEIQIPNIKYFYHFSTLKNRKKGRPVCHSCGSRNPTFIFLVLDSRFHGNDRKSESIEVSFQRAKMLQIFEL